MTLTVELHFSYTYMFYQMTFLFKNFQNFWCILIVYCKICQFPVWATTRSWPMFAQRETIIFAKSTNFSRHFVINNQDPSIPLKIFELKVHLIKLYYLNYNYDNFYPIWSNEVSIYWQDNGFSKCHHLFYSLLEKVR